MPNANLPTWAIVLVDERPACFTDESWLEYLRAVQAECMADKATRKRMERGAIPPYCDACTEKHRAEQEAEGSCWPQKGFERAA